MSITLYDHHPILRHEERDALGTALHWNVAGATVRELHLQLDELADKARELPTAWPSGLVHSAGRPTAVCRSSRRTRPFQRCPTACSIAATRFAARSGS